jgi:hypothetical protein
MVALDDLAKRCLAASLIALVYASALHAQAKPDFAGTWIEATPILQDAEKRLQREEVLYSRGLIHQAVLEGTQLTLKQLRNAATLVVTHTATTITTRQGSSGDGPAATCHLDGSESRNTVGAVVTIAKSAWEGERLVIAETTTYPDGRTAQGKRVWSLDQQGQLVVETGETTSKQVAVYRKA